MMCLSARLTMIAATCTLVFCCLVGVSQAKAATISFGACGAPLGLSDTPHFCRTDRIASLAGSNPEDFQLTASFDPTSGDFGGVNPWGSALVFSAGSYGVLHAFASADRSGVAIPDPTPQNPQAGIAGEVFYATNDRITASSSLPAAPTATGILRVLIDETTFGNGRLSLGSLSLQHGSQLISGLGNIHPGLNSFTIPNVAAGDFIYFNLSLLFTASVYRQCCLTGGLIDEGPLFSFINARDTASISLDFSDPSYSGDSVSGFDYSATAGVPEPATFLLAGTGLAVLLLRTLKRRVK